jgi:hypothetical protein
MKYRRSLIAFGLMMAALSGSATLLPVAGMAQPAGEARPAPRPDRPAPGRHIEGRIAFLRTELGITDAQRAEWDRVASVMRDNAAKLDRTAQEMRAARSGNATVVDRLEGRARFASVRAEGSHAFADAFKALYATMNDDQKKRADDLFRGRGRHR